jgi:hypothetical protein
MSEAAGFFAGVDRLWNKEFEKKSKKRKKVKQRAKKR